MIIKDNEEPFYEELNSERIFIQIKRSFAITKKDLKIYYNKGPVVIQGFLFPLILFFAFTVGRNIIPIYIISGLMAMVIFMTSTSIGPVVFPWETRSKTLERLIACPISIRTILLGNIWSSFIFGCIFSIVPLLLGILFFGLWASINILIIILGIIVASLAFSSFSLILSVPPTDTPANTMILTILVKFPILLLTPLFMPIHAAPYGIVSPLTYFTDIINVGLGESSAFGPQGLLLDFCILILFGLGFILLAFFLHEKTLQKRFRG